MDGPVGHVVITGATGLVGTELVRQLRERGDHVIALSRDAGAARERLGVECVTADLETPGAWTDTFAGARAIVHLAAESLGARRWDARQKQRIRDSRVESTRTIVEAIETLAPTRRPAALLVASAIDYYAFAIDQLGDDEPVTEIDPPSETFLGRVCRDWEREAMAAEPFGVRVACMRLGIVLGPGPAIAKLARPYKLFFGGRIGSGEQWMSWIALVDAAGVFAEAIRDDRYRGPINVVADSIRNREFARELGRVLRRPSFMPAPKFAVRAVAGELAEYLLHGRNVVPARLTELGYAWRCRDLGAALRAALGSDTSSTSL